MNSEYPAGWPLDSEGIPVKLLTMIEGARAIGVGRSYLRKQYEGGRIQAAGRNAKGWVLFDADVVIDFRARRLERLNVREVGHE